MECLLLANDAKNNIDYKKLCFANYCDFQSWFMLFPILELKVS